MSKKNAPYTGGGSGGAAKSQKDAAPARTMSKNDMRLQHMIGNGEPYDAVFAQVQVVCRDDKSCINKQTMNNYGALFTAVNRKRFDVVTLLLDCKADVFLGKYAETSAIMISLNGGCGRGSIEWRKTSADVDEQIQLTLIRNGFGNAPRSTEFWEDRRVGTALHFAMANSSCAVCTLLVFYGADVHKADRMGLNPCHYALVELDISTANESKISLLAQKLQIPEIERTLWADSVRTTKQHPLDVLRKVCRQGKITPLELLLTHLIPAFYASMHLGVLRFNDLQKSDPVIPEAVAALEVELSTQRLNMESIHGILVPAVWKRMMTNDMLAFAMGGHKKLQVPTHCGPIVLLHFEMCDMILDYFCGSFSDADKLTRIKARKLAVKGGAYA